MNHKIAVITIFLCFLSAGVSHAATITWNFSNVVFDGGGTIFGSFDYDTNGSMLYSNISTGTTTGTAFSGSSYTNLDLLASNDGTLALLHNLGSTDLTGEIGLLLLFTSELSTAGASVGLSGFEAICVDSDCSGAPSIFRNILSGEMVSSLSVPEPSILYLIAVAIAGSWRFRNSLSS